MPVLMVDAFTQLAGWQALEADGSTPSAAISVAEDLTADAPSGDGHSLGLTYAASALGHIARRPFAATDLGDFAELRLVLRADRASTGGFFLELRLGSAALPIGAPGNRWSRLLPITKAGQWEVVRLSLTDLPNTVRSALDAVELHCVDAGQAFTVEIDQVLAVQPSMIVDLERALLERLDRRTSLAGSDVPAERVVAGGSGPVAEPCLAIVPLSIRHLPERSVGKAQHCDFTSAGYRVRPAPVAFEALYAIEAIADNRDDQAALIDFLLQAIAPRGELRVAAHPWSIETLDPTAAMPVPQADPAPRQRLHCRVLAWQEQGGAASVHPVQDLVTRIEWKEPAHG